MGKSSKKSSLKTTLLAQQSRLKGNQKAQQAAEQAAQHQKHKKNAGGARDKATLASSTAPKKPTQAKPRAPTVPLTPADRILLIGEGNFSFACALFRSPPASLKSLPPPNVTATAYDSEEECYSKYPDAYANVTFLREKCVEVVFGVDATRMEERGQPLGVWKGKGKATRKWDKIVWNFPHAGKGITDQDRNVLSNQRLILDFLRSSSSVLEKGPIPVAMAPRVRKKKGDEEVEAEEDDEDDDMAEPPLDELDEDAPPEPIMSALTTAPKTRGTVLITLRNQIPYTTWNVPRLAKHPPPPPPSTSIKPTPPYVLLRSFAFHRDMWEGYEHRMTKGERKGGLGKTGAGGEDRTWEFYLKDRPEDE